MTRTYSIGLPVVVTIRDDGRVEYEVDVSDAAIALSDDNDVAYTDEELEADELAIDDDIKARGYYRAAY